MEGPTTQEEELVIEAIYRVCIVHNNESMKFPTVFFYIKNITNIMK